MLDNLCSFLSLGNVFRVFRFGWKTTTTQQTPTAPQSSDQCHELEPWTIPSTHPLGVVSDTVEEEEDKAEGEENDVSTPRTQSSSQEQDCASSPVLKSKEIAGPEPSASRKPHIETPLHSITTFIDVPASGQNVDTCRDSVKDTHTPQVSIPTEVDQVASTAQDDSISKPTKNTTPHLNDEIGHRRIDKSLATNDPGALQSDPPSPADDQSTELAALPQTRLGPVPVLVERQITDNIPGEVVLELTSPRLVYFNGGLYFAELNAPLDLSRDWEIRILPRLLTDFGSTLKRIKKRQALPGQNINNGNVLFRLRMSGRKRRDNVVLRPCVWIQCGSKWCQKLVQNTAKDIKWIGAYGLAALEVVNGAPSLSASPEDPPQPLHPELGNIREMSGDGGLDIFPGVTLFAQIDCTEAIKHNSACGIPIKVQVIRHGQLVSQTTWKIGGVLTINNTSLVGLSTAHGLASGWHDLLVDALEPDDSLSDVTSADDLDSDGSSVPDEACLSTLAPEGSSGSLTLASKGGGSTAEISSSHDISQALSANLFGFDIIRRQHVSAQEAEHQPGPFTAGSPDICTVALDSYLSSLVPDSLLWNIYKDENLNSILIETYLRGPQLTKGPVRVVLDPTRTIKAELIPSTHSFSVLGNFVQTVQIRLPELLETGCSGAWVVRGSALVGVVAALFDDEPVALMIPAEKMLHDVQTFTQGVEKVDLGAKIDNLDQLHLLKKLMGRTWKYREFTDHIARSKAKGKMVQMPAPVPNPKSEARDPISKWTELEWLTESHSLLRSSSRLLSEAVDDRPSLDDGPSLDDRPSLDFDYTTYSEYTGYSYYGDEIPDYTSSSYSLTFSQDLTSASSFFDEPYDPVDPLISNYAGAQAPYFQVFRGDDLPLDIDSETSRTVPCELGHLTGCERRFEVNEFDEWTTHILEHLGGRCPNRSVCWFCDTEYKSSRSADMTLGRWHIEKRRKFEERLQHIWHHCTREGMTDEDIRPDFFVLKHLGEKGLIDRETYEWVSTYREGPERPSFASMSWLPPKIAAERERGSMEEDDLCKQDRQRKSYKASGRSRATDSRATKRKNTRRVRKSDSEASHENPENIADCLSTKGNTGTTGYSKSKYRDSVAADHIVEVKNREGRGGKIRVMNHHQRNNDLNEPTPCYRVPRQKR